MWPLEELFGRRGQKRGAKQLVAVPSLSANSLAVWAAQTPPLLRTWQPRNELENCRAGELAANSPTSCGKGAPAADNADSPAVTLAFPCALRPALGPKGLDLQLRLFQLQVGEPCELPAVVAHQPPAEQHVLLAPLSVLDRTAGILAARLLFPDRTTSAVRWLAGAYTAAAAASVATLLLSPAARSAARQHVRRFKASGPLAAEAALRVEQLGGLLQRYGEPAFVLLATAALWAYVHPTSAQLGECIAALIPVLAGYNQTARQCATKGLSGGDAEELWRRRHKWAAGRTAAYLTDLPDTPPLAGLASTWEVLSICLGATHQGMHFGASAGSSACALGSGSGSGSIELCFWASVALRSQQSRQQLQEAIGAPAGHAVAAPAAAWDGVGSTGAAIQQQQQQQQVAEAVYASQPVLGQPPSLGAPALGTDAALQPWQQEALGTPPLQQLDPLAGAGAAGVAAVASGSACGRATILDSPSEMLERPCRFPSGTTSGHADTLADAWQQQQQQQGPQLSTGSAAADPGSNSASDFMHPEHWLAARQADGHLVVEAGSEASSHSFLLPGRAYSDASSNDGGEEEERLEPLNALSPAAARLLPPGLSGHDTVAPLPATLPTAQEQQWLPIEQLEPHELTAAAPPAPTPATAAVGGGGVGGGELAPPPLPLYGRGDHAVQHDLTLAERLQLAVRAAQLLALFAPFLLLGSAMLLLAARLDARAERRKQVVGLVPVAEEPVPLGGVVALEAGASATGERLRTRAFKLLLKACRRSGPAFIKWGQWAATREDIFPPSFCSVLSELHDKAPTHPLAQTREIVESAFRAPLESLFLSFEDEALASGSIAQVHRARLLVDGQVREVAVKVRHPGVTYCIWADFQLLRPLAAMTARVKSLRSLNLSDSVSQFSHTMTAQADLRVEAEHLRRFYRNFATVSSSVHVPQPIAGYCTQAVLVESYEPGQSVSTFIQNPHPQNTQIVALGVDTYLKMLLQDNFVHTDLHPGNILVRPAGGGRLTTPATAGEAEDRSAWKRLELVLLDFGLAEELTPPVRKHFISFLHTIAKGDGVRAAYHLLRWSANQRCPDIPAFTADVVTLFRERCNIHAEEGINLDAVMKAVLHLARKHEVSIDSNYAALVVGVCVIVGFAASLDRRVNLMDAATPCFLFYTLTGRVNGRLYM